MQRTREELAEDVMRFLKDCGVVIVATLAVMVIVYILFRIAILHEYLTILAVISIVATFFYMVYRVVRGGLSIMVNVMQ